MATEWPVHHEAPGLPADWLNAWLAAIGVTVLLPDVKLSWTSEVVPHAVFRAAEGINLSSALFDALPSEAALETTAVARRHESSGVELRRNVSLEAFRSRAEIERQDHSTWLASQVSDLVSEKYLKPDDLATGPFNVSMPGGTTLVERAMTCRGLIDSVSLIRDSLNGTPTRFQANGLGFDCRRVATGVQSKQRSKVHVDPVVEFLAYFALTLFPLRGDGRHAVRQRGWSGGQFQRGAFRWFSWSVPLDVWAIDAMLDQPDLVAEVEWQNVSFQLVNERDTTRLLFSEQVR